MIATDVYLEQVLIPKGTAEEMAQFFVDTVNKAYTEDRTGFSRMKDGIRAVQLQDGWKLEIGGRHFVILQWNCMKDEELDYD